MGSNRTETYAARQNHITLEGCRVPEEARLPGTMGLGSTLPVLAHLRYSVGRDGLGLASDCHEVAQPCTKGHEQLVTFGTTTWEVTTVETRIECMDPPDDATRAHRRALAEAAE